MGVKRRAACLVQTASTIDHGGSDAEREKSLYILNVGLKNNFDYSQGGPSFYSFAKNSYWF